MGAGESTGMRIRREREHHGMSLRELARRAGLSPSLVSQIETGKTEPSVSSLAAISREIGISLNELVFGEPDPAEPREPAPPAGVVLDPGERRSITLESNVTWERLTADRDPDVDFLYVVYEVGSASAPPGSLMRHAGKEYGFVISGTLNVTIGFDEYTIGPGGSISFDSTVPHRLWNAGDEPVRGVWAVVGRQGGAAVRTVGPELYPPQA